MADHPHPRIYSIAAHRGFADALVAGLIPRYAEAEFGLARVTLLLPSSRARRTLAEAFVRHAGENGAAGLLMPRMAVIGDLDLDETLGPLLDPLGAADIPPAVDPDQRLLVLAQILREVMGERVGSGATLLRLARETAATMDRLLVEGIDPDTLLDDKVTGIFPELAGHWQDSLRDFIAVQKLWLGELQAIGALDAAARRNRLFEHAAARWKAHPPAGPLIAAGITSAAPALARLLRVIAQMPQGAVILPDFDLTMHDAVWDELGRAGAAPAPGDTPFAKDDAVTHPQYHLKLLLNRMAVRREEVQPWHRRGMGASEPERSHAIGALFLPPEASKTWVELPAAKRRLSGVRVMTSANPEEEAQAIAVLIREAVEQPERRVALITPDRSLARRVVHHLARWNIIADDSAGRPLSQTAAGRLVLLLAEVIAEDAAPVPLMALLAHPLVDGGMERGAWLRQLRRVEKALRGPRMAGGLAPVASIVGKHAANDPDAARWFAIVEGILTPLLALDEPVALADVLDALASAGEALCGEQLWAREDGRALAGFIDGLRPAARAVGFALRRGEIALLLRDAMEQVAVRPPYGGHARVQLLGLLESRMNRADLMICAGLNEGSWPARGGVDALLAPPILRALGVPGADFRIGLSAHDLAGALGAPEVVLSRAERDEAGPAIPSRFLLRIEALLGDLLDRHRETRAVELARAMVRAERVEPPPRPRPMPSAEQRDVDISATALDRLLGDPFQFYAGKIMQLNDLEPLDADPSPAWQGTVAHAILQRWHEARREHPGAALAPIMAAVLDEANADALTRGLWVPRLEQALRWIEEQVETAQGRAVLGVEREGRMTFEGVQVHGRADRIDRLADGTLAIIDYKTGKPPSAAMVEQGYALQLGILGLIARQHGFAGIAGEPAAYEYWSLGKADNDYGFGYVDVPLKVGRKTTGILPEDFLPHTAARLAGAIARFIKGNDPFTARENPDYPAYDTYDQLMRLDEWIAAQDAEDAA